MTDTPNETVVQFKTKEQKESEEINKFMNESKEMLLEILANQLPDIDGVLVLTLRKGAAAPNVMFGGEFNPLAMLGALELSKTVLADITFEALEDDSVE